MNTFSGVVAGSAVMSTVRLILGVDCSRTDESFEDANELFLLPCLFSAGISAIGSIKAGLRLLEVRVFLLLERRLGVKSLKNEEELFSNDDDESGKLFESDSTAVISINPNPLLLLLLLLLLPLSLPSFELVFMVCMASSLPLDGSC